MSLVMQKFTFSESDAAVLIHPKYLNETIFVNNFNWT